MTILLSQQNSFATPGRHEACITPAGLKNVETLYASRQDPERQNVPAQGMRGAVPGEAALAPRPSLGRQNEPAGLPQPGAPNSLAPAIVQLLQDRHVLLPSTL